MRNQCWAAALGDCAGPITNEHPISEAIFDAEVLTVQGAAWPAESRDIPVATLAAPSLCDHHNRLLSPDDAAVGRFARSLRQLNAPDACGEIDVNGWALERWCVKALMGIVANNWHRSSQGHRITLDQSPEDLAAAAFGRTLLCGGRGLNVVACGARVTVGIEGVGFKILVANAEASIIVGLIVTLPPIVLVLTLAPGDVTALLKQINLPLLTELSDVAAGLRPVRLDLRGRASSAHIVVKFDWSNQTPGP
jgi:hypothetical protein